MAVQIDGSQGSVIATSGSYSGGVSIGGTLTYEDVTNIDAVGLITARSGIEIGASPGVGASISVDGNAVFSGITTFNSRVLIGTETEGHTSADDLTIATSGHTGITLRSGASSTGNIYFSDATSGGDEYNGSIIYDQTDDHMRFSTNENERLRINSTGKVGINTNASAAWLNIHQGDSGTVDAIIITNASTTNNGLSLGVSSAEDAFFWNGSNTNMTVATNNTERLRITSGGDVLIGRTSTSTGHTLCVQADSGAEAIAICGRSADDISELAFFENDSSTRLGEIQYRQDHVNFRHRVGYISFATGGTTERLRIAADGQTTLTGGTVSRAFKVNSTHTAGGEIACFDNGVNNHYGALVISAGEIDRECRLEAAYGSSLMTFWTDNGERMRINASGRVTVGTDNDDGGGSANTDDGCVLRQDGLIAARVATGTNSVAFTAKTIDTGSATALRCMSAQTQVGSVTFNSGGTSFNTSSDYRRKENIVSITDGITKVKQLKTYRFNFKDNPSETVDGFLAHEAQEVIPHVVKGTKDQVATAEDVASEKATSVGDPIYQVMDQSKLVPLLTAALQEAIAKIEVLESEVAALKSS